VAKTQTLSFPIRLPDAMQAAALRLLDVSRSAINQMITELWPQLDLFVSDRTGPAWKQVERHLLSRGGHGSRQERCEMEQAGRILRAQASRKQVFETVLPLLSEGLIKPAQGKRPARKDHRLINEQVRTWRAQIQDAGEDAEAFMAMTNLLEQACNHYLQTGEFPTTYESLQPLPVLSIGHLTFAGDDGMKAGQTYRARIEMTSFCDVQTRQEHKLASLSLRLRTPNRLGKWAWGEWSDAIPLPPTICISLWQGATTQAPTLREIRGDDGSRVAVLDLILEVPAKYVSPLEQETRVLGWDWGVRSLITVSILEKPEGDEPYRQVSPPIFLDTGGIDGKQARLRREIDRLKGCRDRYGQLVKQATEGRGRGVRGRFRNWRNTTTVRGELWRVLRYKCHLFGIRARQVEPRGTTHTCPRCHQPATTYASAAPQDRTKAISWGPWLCCSNPECQWNGARDYAASLNIARLGMAFLVTYHQTKRYVSYRMTSSEVNSCSYIGQEATLLLPSQGITPRPSQGKHVYYAGWSYASSLRTSRPRNLLAVLSTSQLRKYVLQRA
jgi:hypothetical protein